MNIERLKMLQEQVIKAAPSFNMMEWARPWGYMQAEWPETLVTNEPPPCGIQACLAGETLIMLNIAKVEKCNMIPADDRWDGAQSTIPYLAAEELGLSIEQKQRLFYLSKHGHGNGQYYWPVNFELEYNAAKTPLDRAQVAVRRIQHFIDTNGNE